METAAAGVEVEEQPGVVHPELDLHRDLDAGGTGGAGVLGHGDEAGALDADEAGAEAIAEADVDVVAQRGDEFEAEAVGAGADAEREAVEDLGAGAGGQQEGCREAKAKEFLHVSVPNNYADCQR